MESKELRAYLQEVAAENDRKRTPQNIILGCIGLVAVVILWMGDARITQLMQPIANKQMEHSFKIEAVEDKIEKREVKIDQILELVKDK